MKKFAFVLLALVAACDNNTPGGGSGTEDNTGPQGPQGEVGPAGPQGVAGVDGVDGTSGTDGVDGAQGIQGETGPMGPQGNIGSSGQDGVDGAPGADGLDGEDGVSCWDANKNFDCDLVTEDVNADTVCNVSDCVGAVGGQGDTGEQGPPGLTGPQGPQGEPGLNGHDGVAGPPGSDGPPGLNGANGLNCWDDNEDDLCDLFEEDTNLDGVCNTRDCHGRDGAPGLDGAPGQNGEQGPQGETGPEGAQGPMGPQGPQGLQGLEGAPGIQGPAGTYGQGRGIQIINGVLSADFDAQTPEDAVASLEDVNGVEERVSIIESATPTTVSLTVASGTSGTATCPGGSIATGGGFSGIASNKTVTRSTPGGANSWTVDVTAPASSFTVHVVCLSLH